MDGIINIYKPIGITSFDAVRIIRKLSHVKKVGHTGTLDPLASGVLPICIGKGTKIVDYIMSENKIYLAELKLGVVTETYDREGAITKEHAVIDDEVIIKNVINSFIGEIDQVPPMYSALKVNGKKLYELARQGITIERKSRKITINNIEIIEFNPPYIKMKVYCSKGTYIRSLCYDIGEKLGCGGTMWNLERVCTGIFTKENSVNIEELNGENINNFLIPLDEALNNYEKIIFDNKYRKELTNGVIIFDDNIIKSLIENRLYKVYLSTGEFLGLGSRYSLGFKIVKLLI